MSGHSKWANIKHKKEANDRAKGNVFAKISRIITISVLESGGVTDPNSNFKLRLAIEKARACNMPKENIDRAINKAVGPDKSQLKEVIYEGFAPYGVSLIISVTTDNQNRTLSEVRNILERFHGKLGMNGSVGYLFTKCALLIVNKDKNTQEAVFEASDRLGAYDITEDSERYYIYFPFANLGHIKENLNNIIYESAEVDYKPQSPITLDDESKLLAINNIVEALESLDDVHKVYTNLC